MASVAEAIRELGITEWVCRGEPASEAEFNQMFRKITGADSDGTATEMGRQLAERLGRYT